jgi:hypothetical protein
MFEGDSGKEPEKEDEGDEVLVDDLFEGSDEEDDKVPVDELFDDLEEEEGDVPIEELFKDEEVPIKYLFAKSKR